MEITTHGCDSEQPLCDYQFGNKGSELSEFISIAAAGSIVNLMLEIVLQSASAEDRWGADRGSDWDHMWEFGRSPVPNRAHSCPAYFAVAASGQEQVAKA